MRILITGTTGGIGGAVISVAAGGGHDVVALNRPEWGTLGTFLEGQQPFDGVVFATGFCCVKPLSRIEDADFTDMLSVNCGLFLRLMRELLRRRLFSKTGARVVAISSISAEEGWPGGALYCASKGALSSLCRAMDAELVSRGVRVHALEPRYVRTKMFDMFAGRMGVPPSNAEEPIRFAERILNELKIEGD